MKKLILKNKYIQSYQNNKVIVMQFLRFCIVGVANTLITLGSILILYNILRIDYRISNIIGYSLGLINSFIWNKIWTFKSQNKFYNEIGKFFIMFFVSYFINFGVLIFSAEVLFINKNISQIVGNVFYTITNYLGNKLWTFNRV